MCIRDRDKWIEKTRHKAIIPDLGRIGGFVTKHYWIFIILFLVIIGPAFYGQNHNQVYYDLMGTLPDNLESVKAGNALENDFDMGATHVILASSDLNSKDARNLENEISDAVSYTHLDVYKRQHWRSQQSRKDCRRSLRWYWHFRYHAW